MAKTPHIDSDARGHHDEAPGSRLRILENTGHYPMLESPEEWSAALLQLLQTL